MNAARCELYQAISKEQAAHPDGFIILAGDFNHADLKTVLPKLYQHVDFPTRGANILDTVYTTKRGAYKACPLPHIGLSDHITVMLMQAYRHESESHQTGSEASMCVARAGLLQDCLRTTDWEMFK